MKRFTMKRYRNVEIGCPNTPIRKGYCIDHQHVDPRIKFKYGQEIFECNINQTSCKTQKKFALPCEKKSRTVGEFLAVYNCGIICVFRKVFGAESLFQEACFLLDLYENIQLRSNFIGYDDGYHLKKFIVSKKTERLEKLREKIIIIDRLHYKGHKKSNSYCKELCNPNNNSEIKDANTSVVEQFIECPKIINGLRKYLV
ncbi:hypothetical protein BpHYR1_013236 [Brachionus plicatilis]|uniref:Uncharacterized protein n=1 Tax=Brachionus plicatilis TaxID=10195 RepID=A0A3M7S153_BRAPC|nr:hypothetical protein BpHYR1_013236 [Brachionus plicatilis]